jgi:NADPH:quinone reductase-like Zn-dependent oxidoreductase
MKALYFTEHGELDVLQYGDVPDPRPGPDDVVVRVKACALNYLDIWVRRGWPGLKLAMPHWGGADVSGEVAEVGENVSTWRPGQVVVCDPGVNIREDEYTQQGEDSVSPGYKILGEDKPGGFAEYIVVPARNLKALPEEWEFPQAAAPLLVALTAWRMLKHRAQLKSGESVLIIGAGGGVNSVAIQIGKLLGAQVLVVASNATKAERATALGADAVFDRSQVDWSREVFKFTEKRGVDVVVDNVGQATLPLSLRAVARGGRIVIVGNTSSPQVQIDTRFIFGKQISLIGSTMGSHRDFDEVTELLFSGKLKPVIHAVLPLSEGKEAYAQLERGEHFGKIVLEP